MLMLEPTMRTDSRSSTGTTRLSDELLTSVQGEQSDRPTMSATLTIFSSLRCSYTERGTCRPPITGYASCTC